MKNASTANRELRPKTGTLSLKQHLLRFFPDGFIVGGALRDHLLGRKFSDLDIAVPRKDIMLRGKSLARELDASFFPLDDENGVYRITAKHAESLQLDFSAFQGSGIESDLTRRDFTVNAMAYPLNDNRLDVTFSAKNGITLRGLDTKTLLDPFGGRADLAKKIVRLACKKAFREDPLRLLRAFRIGAELGFGLDARLRTQAKKDARLLSKSSGERVREELLKILACPAASQSLRELDRAGLLPVLLPHTEQQKKCAMIYYGKGGVLLHTFKALDRLEFLLQNPQKAFPHFHAKLAAERTRAPLLKLGVLLHDMAKPATAQKLDGRLRFFGHEETGAQMAQDLLSRLRFSRNDSRLICALIREHMRPGNLAANAMVSDKAVYRFFRDLGESAVPALLACWADHASYMPLPELKRNLSKIQLRPRPIKPGSLPREGTVRTLRHLQVINHMLRMYFEERDRILPPKILTGNDIMTAFGLKPGPEIGRLLELARLAQVQGRAADKGELLAYLKKNVKSKA